MRLARLLRSQGRVDKAHEPLAAGYASFTEGFDTPDLHQAGELLSALRS